jgi:hypothetical protein
MSTTDLTKFTPPPTDRKARVRAFLANRHRLFDVLGPHRGNWVAINWDGTAVLAAAPDLLALERLLSDAGIDPQAVAFERVPDDDICWGAGELE